jgi:hypothetical protein
MRVITHQALRRVGRRTALAGAAAVLAGLLLTPPWYPADRCPTCFVIPPTLHFSRAAIVVAAPDRITTRADGEVVVTLEWPNRWPDIPSDAEDYGRPCDTFDVTLESSELRFSQRDIRFEIPCGAPDRGRVEARVVVAADEPGLRRFTVASRGRTAVDSIGVMSRWYVHWVVVDIVWAAVVVLGALLALPVLSPFWRRVFLRLGVDLVDEPRN